MAALSVRVLGEFSIDGIDVRRLADRKARTMLHLLALARGRPVSAAALADALWAASPPARPSDQLAVLASRLRRALGRDAIEHDDHGYRFHYDWLDADELATVTAEAERRLADGNISGAAGAARIGLALVRGPLPDPVTETEWVLAEHAAVQRQLSRSRHVAAAALLAAGDWLDAREVAVADVRADPYDEEAVRLAMQADVAGGRPAMALATFEDLRRTLADELGTDPAPATAALHTAILRGAHTSPPVRRTPVPLVGRSSQLEHLDGLVARTAGGRLRVVAVTGEAGIGKTTLLRAWSQSRADLGDTVLFGTCRPLERSVPLDAVLVAVAEHLRRAGRGDLLADDAGVLSSLLGPLVEGEEAATAPGAPPLDPALGITSVYAALTSVLRRIAGERGAILVVDDAHLAGPALHDWISFVARRQLPLLLVAGLRPGQPPLPHADTVNVGPLDRAATAQLVGPDRAGRLFERSGGHPLFLTELARRPDEALPASLISAIEQLCGDLGAPADLVRTAAVLGTEVDVDLLATVLGRAPLDVLADLELAETSQLLVEDSGQYSFRHELVRDALTAGTRSARAALLHRDAALALQRRPDADPLEVAEHARLGGDLSLAAGALRTAARRAGERFDHATAEQLLDQALILAEDDAAHLDRARVRILRGRYADAEADVAASGGGAQASELRAWAAYFDRRFDDAVGHARDGELAATDPALRTRCLVVGGRTLHARGDLDEAERLLTGAVGTASGTDRVSAAAWLGVLHAHRSRPATAIELLRPATQPGVGAGQTSATLHALLFTGHAHALAGRPAAALAAFDRYTAEVEHRQVPRFSGRGVNFGGWVLRNVGATSAALDAHQQALVQADGHGTPEVRVAALEDLAEDRLLAADPDAAETFLGEAAQYLTGDLVFGWRLAMKHASLRTRVALLRGDPAAALAAAGRLASEAGAVGVPRYAATARLLEHQARAALGEPVDHDAARRDLGIVEEAVALEAWWWAGETGVALGEPRWLDRAETLAGRLAGESGSHRETLQAEATRRLEAWRLRTR